MLFISKNSEKNFKYIRQIPGLNYQQIYFYPPRYLLTRIDILELCSNDEWRQREMERLVLCSYLLWHRLVLIQMGFQREDISASLVRVRNSLIYSGLQLSIRYGLTGCGFMVLFSLNFFQVIMTYRSICESLKNRIRVVYHRDFS